MQLLRRPAARQDLIDIWLHVAADNVAAADALLDRMEAALERLADFPQGGRPREELAAGLRSIPVGPYLLFYRVEPTAIDLIRVIHGARDLVEQAME